MLKIVLQEAGSDYDLRIESFGIEVVTPETRLVGAGRNWGRAGNRQPGGAAVWREVIRPHGSARFPDRLRESLTG
jgi:hypothetical protein